jgi:hypothetical protein
MSLFVWIIAVVVVMLSSLCPSVAGADTYTFLYKDGNSVFVTRSNNHGVSVGTFGVQGLLLREDGGSQIIQMPPDSSPFSTPSMGDINDAEEMVGEYFTQTGAVGFIFKNGVFTTLQVPGEGRTVPQGLNNRGTVVGTFLVAGQNTSQAFIYKNGAYTKVAIPGAIFVTFWDLNDAGDIVGEATTSTFPFEAYSFLYRNGTVIPLPTYPGADNTRVFSINNKGEMTGQLITRRPGQLELQQGFILRDGQFEVFRLLGSWAFVPFGINDKGEVTGSFESNAGLEGFGPTIIEGTSFIRRPK